MTANATFLVGNDRYQPFRTVPAVFDAVECDAIIAAAGSFVPGHVGDVEPVVDLGARSVLAAEIAPAAEHQWIFERLAACVTEVNATTWDFDLTGFVEPPQVLCYGAGGHYDWHVDIGPGPFSTRKLTMVVQLSRADGYDGGDLLLAEPYPEGTALPRDRGSAACFPTWTPHRVAPVQRGNRYALVCWVAGPCFR